MDKEEPIVANIVINGETVQKTTQSIHWEPKDLKRLIMDKFGLTNEDMWSNFSITDV